MGRRATPDHPSRRHPRGSGGLPGHHRPTHPVRGGDASSPPGPDLPASIPPLDRHGAWTKPPSAGRTPMPSRARTRIPSRRTCPPSTVDSRRGGAEAPVPSSPLRHGDKERTSRIGRCRRWRLPRATLTHLGCARSRAQAPPWPRTVREARRCAGDRVVPPVRSRDGGEPTIAPMHDTPSAADPFGDLRLETFTERARLGRARPGRRERLRRRCGPRCEPRRDGRPAVDRPPEVRRARGPADLGHRDR